MNSTPEMEQDGWLRFEEDSSSPDLDNEGDEVLEDKYDEDSSPYED